MNLEEHAAKPLLQAAGIAVPAGELVTTAEAAAAVVARLGRAVIKAQVPTGKRGKSGGISLTAAPADGQAAAARILGMTIGGHRVERLLVERQAAIERELYAAIVTDADSKGPLLLVAAQGGMDVEEIAAGDPEALLRLPIDVRHGLAPAGLAERLRPLGSALPLDQLADLLCRLYRVFADHDAELLEINPLALTTAGLVALDGKLVLDDAAIPRQPSIAALATPEPQTPLEARGGEHGLRYIELEGEVGVLANGAGLTMATMDSIRHQGGRPANFLEIGGEAYRLGEPALELVLANPRVKSLVVNFCGAFARTDVMTEAVVEAWAALRPGLPVFFSIHGTGDVEANALVRDRLGLEPFDRMDDAIAAAVEAAR